MSDIFIGLDGEMTGGDVQPPGQKPHYQKFALVQIGMALIEPGFPPAPVVFVSNIGYDTFESKPEAMAVHKITEDAIRAASRPAAVDAAAVRWLDERGIQKAIPVGYSVNSFDMPYVREYLPELGRRISMRAVDLNGVVFTVARVTGRSYKSIKGAAKSYAEKMIQKASASLEANEQFWPVAHNAGFDSLVALYSWGFLCNMISAREIHDHL